LNLHELHVHLSVALVRVVHVEELRDLCEFWLAKVVDTDNMLDWSVVRPEDTMQASVVFHSDVKARVILEEHSVGIGRGLILLLFVSIVPELELIRGPEGDLRLDEAWEVAFLL